MRGTRYLVRVVVIALGFTGAVCAYLSGWDQPVDGDTVYGAATVGTLIGVLTARQ